MTIPNSRLSSREARTRCVVCVCVCVCVCNCIWTAILIFNVMHGSEASQAPPYVRRYLPCLSKVSERRYQPVP